MTEIERVSALLAQSSLDERPALYIAVDPASRLGDRGEVTASLVVFSRSHRAVTVHYTYTRAHRSLDAAIVALRGLVVSAAQERVEVVVSARHQSACHAFLAVLDVPNIVSVRCYDMPASQLRYCVPKFFARIDAISIDDRAGELRGEIARHHATMQHGPALALLCMGDAWTRGGAPSFRAL